MLTGCGGGAAARRAPLLVGSSSGVLWGPATRGHAVPQTVLPLHHRWEGGDVKELRFPLCGRLKAHLSLCLCQGVVSGILVVTPTKIFFDPSKTHPLVTEHGFEDYLLSCTIDSLASVSFFLDISHIHFNTSQQRSVLFCCRRTQIRQPGFFHNDLKG